MWFLKWANKPTFVLIDLRDTSVVSTLSLMRFAVLLNRVAPARVRIVRLLRKPDLTGHSKVIAAVEMCCLLLAMLAMAITTAWRGQIDWSKNWISRSID